MMFDDPMGVHTLKSILDHHLMFQTIENTTTSNKNMNQKPVSKHIAHLPEINCNRT